MAASEISLSEGVKKPTLFDMPVSNNGARIRYLIYAKGLEGEIDIVSPMALGGLKSPEYLALNPQGKMPMLLLPDGTAFPESDVIARYVCDKYEGTGPTFNPSTPEARAKAALAIRFLDVYISSIQGVMYKGDWPVEERSKTLGQLAEQLDALDALVVGPYVLGAEMSLADASLFPTLVFCDEILPKHFGWDLWAKRPNLKAHYDAMQADPHGKRVIEEMRGGLAAWEANDRWGTLGITADVQNNPDVKWAY